MKILLFILDKLLFRKYFLKKGSPPGGMGGSEKRKLYIYCPLCPLGCLSHRGRVDYPAGIPTIRLTEVFTMNTRIEKAFISIVMELPFYFTLSVRERHSLLSRLTKHYQSLISEFEKEQDLYKDLLKPNYWFSSLYHSFKKPKSIFLQNSCSTFAAGITFPAGSLVRRYLISYCSSWLRQEAKKTWQPYQTGVKVNKQERDSRKWWSCSSHTQLMLKGSRRKKP